MPFITADPIPSEERYQFIAKGFTANVFRIAGSKRVCKSFLPNGSDVRFPIEREAYERFMAREHPTSILEYFGVDDHKPSGLVLELAENGPVWEYLWDHPETDRTPSSADLFRWARQAAEALQFAHSCGVLHSDVHCANFLFDEHLNLKIADFAEASIDGGHSLLFYRTTHCLPGARKASMASEIFALGSSMYFMVTGHDLFPELSDSDEKPEIRRRLRDGEFPETKDFPVLGQFIQKCWRREYRDMEEVLTALRLEEHEMNGVTL